MSRKVPSGILDLVSRVEGGPYFTISQVSQQVNKSVASIKRYLKDKPELKPKNKMPLGEDENNFVWLYTRDEISRIKKHAKNQHPGRPKKSG